MHEANLVRDLVRQVDNLVLSQGGKRAKAVRVKIRPQFHLSGEYFRSCFEAAAKQTTAAGAKLEWEITTECPDSQAQDILLESLEIIF